VPTEVSNSKGKVFDSTSSQGRKTFRTAGSDRSIDIGTPRIPITADLHEPDHPVSQDGKTLGKLRVQYSWRTTDFGGDIRLEDTGEIFCLSLMKRFHQFTKQPFERSVHFVRFIADQSSSDTQERILCFDELGLAMDWEHFVQWVRVHKGPDRACLYATIEGDEDEPD